MAMFTRPLEIGAAALASAAAYVLYSNSQDIAKAKSLIATDQKYQAGEAYAGPKRKAQNFFADPKTIAVDLLRDYKSVRKNFSLHELVPILDDVLKKGEPLDDKKGTTEQLIKILTTLPHDSQVRTRLTNKFIDTLWDNLQHPPLSYVGGDVKYEVVNDKTQQQNAPVPESVQFKAPDNTCILQETVPTPPDGVFQYRTPDGSYNNVLNPNLGRAGTPYAKSVHTSKTLHGVKPDAGLLFDMLMARGDDTFHENPAGISAVLFYHASIIIHDVFRTNRTNMNISDTSSYLDLAPLYGSSLKDQIEIRTMKEGKLKPDTFHEKRLLGQPPGVNVMLVMYSRFHNYVADMLLKINENGRFTLAVAPGTPGASTEDIAKAVAKQDHDLFNTARLIVGGLYINICLHDYIRGITNTHHSDSTWTLDPRVEMDKHFDADGAPRGIGNQVSVEFNLLYRFHSVISKRDEKWLNEFFLELLPNRKPDDLHEATHAELLQGLQRFEQSIPKDPSVRTFGGLQRQENGRFRDEDLVRIMKESMEDPAGTFGARMVPKALRVVEILGILQARKWQVASLNEFRDFFGLKRHETFKDINSDDEIAGLLENLYTHPDMVELYPGLMIESFKPSMNPGCGICPTYSVGRAILSDAVTLVRSDRFNTIDYTVSNLTNWGFNEVKQDYKTLGGSMFYRLVQRAVPGWFPYNSLHVMQPMYTRKANEAIARELGTISQYSLEDPKPPRPTTLLKGHAAIKEVLEDTQRFAVPWLAPMNDLFPGEKDYGWFMLSGDGPKNAANKKIVQGVFKSIPGLFDKLSHFVSEVGWELMEENVFNMKKDLRQVDIVRDVAIPLNARMLADLFYLDLKTPENQEGSLSTTELYEHMLNIRIWGTNSSDPAMSWNRRRWAQDGARVITDSTRKLVQDVANHRTTGAGISSYLSALFARDGPRNASIKQGSLRSYGYQIVDGLLAADQSVEQVTDTLWLICFGGIGVPVTAFCEILQFFLKAENVKHWAKIQDCAAKGDDRSLRQYVLEAHRLVSTQRTVRIAKQPTVVNDNLVSPGSAVICMLGEAGRDPSEIERPLEFVPSRRQKASPSFSIGMHECFGQEVARTFIVGMVKLAAGLENLRAAPGNMGAVKSVQTESGKVYLNDSWSYLTLDASTWKVHFSGYGKGAFKATARSQEQKMELQQIYFGLKKRKAEGMGAELPN